MEESAKEFKYSAFISYSHKDEAFAERLQEAIESYRLPGSLRRMRGGLPDRLKPVFRDKTDLNPGILWEELRRKLSESQHLILLCSPESARSEYVNREVEEFRRLGRGGDIIPVIVRGEVNARAQGGEPDPKRECYPPLLLEEVRRNDEKQLLGVSLEADGARKTALKAAARMLGLDADDLIARDRAREFRRKAWLLAAGALAAALIAVSGFLYSREQRRIEAEADFNRTKTAYFGDYVDEYGIPKGLFPLTEEQIRPRSSHYRFESARGRLQRVVHANSAGIPVEHDEPARAERPMIQTFSYNDAGKLIHADYQDRHGNLKLRLLYNEDCSVIDFDWVDNSDKGMIVQAFLPAQTTSPAAGALGLDDAGGQRSEAQRWVLTRDDRGRVIRALYRKYKSAVPARDADGVSGREFVLDEHGRALEIWCLDEDGKRLRNATASALGRKYEYRNSGFSRQFYGLLESRSATAGNRVGVVEYTLDEHDNVAAMRYSPSKGIVEFRYQYDTRGNKSEEAFFGADGKPYRHEKGYARVKWRHDEDGNITEAAFFDAQGAPCPDGDGVAKRTWRHDKRGNPAEMAFFDAQGAPCADRGGVAKRTGRYDERGRPTEVAFFDAAGRPFLTGDGFARVAWKYDERGNRAEEAYFGADGKPCPGRKGFSRLIWRYDERGNRAGEIYFGADGRPCADREGIAGKTWKHDERGNLVERASFDTEGRPCGDREGIAKRIWRYDDRRNKIEEAYFDAQGRPRPNKKGIARLTWQYDERGDVAESSCFNAEFKILTVKYDVDRNYTAFLFNPEGEITICSVFDAKGRRRLHEKGFSSLTCRYDDRGNKTEEAYFGIDGNLCLIDEGYARVVSKYDGRGNRTEAVCLDANGKLCMNRDGYARATWKYDEHGNILEEVRFDTDGFPVYSEPGERAF